MKRTTLIAFCLALLGTACKRGPDPSSQAEPAAKEPGDQLAAGEHLPDAELTFGIEVPRGMTVLSRFKDVVQLQGPLSVEQLARYYRQHIAAAIVELGENNAVFPRVYVNGDDTKRIYRIVISKKRKGSLVRISDITAPPTVKGLDERERWERAGLTPSGSQKDRLGVY
jgi:hypothetical protein